MRVLLDTSVIISFLVDDKHTDKAEKIFTDIFEGKLHAYVTPLIIVETCGVISRTSERESAELSLKKLNEWFYKGIVEILDQTEDIIKIACNFAINYRIKGADAIIGATAHYNKVKLATFDQEMINKLKPKVDFYL